MQHHNCQFWWSAKIRNVFVWKIFGILQNTISDLWCILNISHSQIKLMLLLAQWKEIAICIACTRCVIITGTPNFRRQNLVNMRFICTKIFRPNAWDNAAWSGTRIVHHMYCLYRVTSLWTWRHWTVNMTSVLLIRQSDSGALVCARVKAKCRHFEHILSH